MKTISFRVKGMHCKSCEMLITEELQEISETKVLDVSSSEGVVKISYNEKTTSLEDLKKAILSAGEFSI